MTEDQKYEIAVLAEDYANKQLRYDCLGMANAHGKSPEEAMKQTIDYQLADAERWEAWFRLQKAKAQAAFS